MRGAWQAERSLLRVPPSGSMKPGGIAFREHKAGWILDDKKASRLSDKVAVA